MKRTKKSNSNYLSFSTAWRSACHKKEQELCNRLQEKTRYWSRRRKIAMLTFIIVFWGGFYAAILIKAIRGEDEKGMYLIHQPSSFKDSALTHPPEKFIPENNQRKNPP
jgi:hypothetical protein